MYAGLLMKSSVIGEATTTTPLVLGAAEGTGAAVNSHSYLPQRWRTVALDLVHVFNYRRVVTSRSRTSSLRESHRKLTHSSCVRSL